MNKNSFAIITPSYAPDFERCRLLTWSISQFISPTTKHYIVVDRRDLNLFRKLQTINTEIITVESVIPWWIQRIPFFKNGWFSLKTIPVRNWLLQQIVKISIAQYIEEEVLVFVDSDTSFLRQLNFESFINRKGQVRLFREVGVDTGTERFKWHQTASQLLGLPSISTEAPGYIGNAITWKRDNVFKLYEHLEKISGRGWIETLASSWHLSEYILYGVFVEHILKSESGHYFDDSKICHEYWSPQAMTDQELKGFFASLPSHHKAVMISAKAGIPVDKYEPLVKGLAFKERVGSRE